MVRSFPQKHSASSSSTRGFAFSSRYNVSGKIPRYQHQGRESNERTIGEYSWSKFQNTEERNQRSSLGKNGLASGEKFIGTVILNTHPPSSHQGTSEGASGSCPNIFRKFAKTTPKMEVLDAEDTNYDSTEIQVIEEHHSLILVDEVGESESDPICDKDESIIEVFSSSQRPSGSSSFSTVREKKDEEERAVLISESEEDLASATNNIVTISEDEEDIICIKEVKATRSVPQNWIDKVRNINEDMGNINWTDSDSRDKETGSAGEKSAGTSTSSSSSRNKKSKSLDRFSKDCRLQKNWEGVRNWQTFIVDENPEDVSSVFTLCTYNVLCQTTTLSTQYLYRHLEQCPEYLTWEYRWNGLKEELTAINADVIGLQEVENIHYQMYFNPLMRSNGYNGYYKQKSGGIEKVDGCAIFWKPDVFEHVDYSEVNYYVNDGTILDKPNVGQILVLKCRKTGEIVIVGNTHLIFNTERGDIKLAQLAMLFANIHAVKAKYEKSNPSVIIFGDFNIEPNSLVYNYITTGSAHIHNEMVRLMSGQSDRTGGLLCDIRKLLHPSCRVGLDARFIDAKITTSVSVTEHLTHPFHFRSVHSYNKQNRSSEKREISTYHKDQANPDFIFYNPPQSSGKTLQLKSRLSLPTVNNLKKMGPWPNCTVPSDHIPLVAKFRLVKSN